MKLGKEITHPSHPQHKLKIEYTEIPFSCDGCSESGIGFTYRCEACDFDLHKICALAPSVITHPFYTKCEFRLASGPPGTLSRVCDACRKIVVGFVYHCAKCGFDLHPCCANLPNRLDDGNTNLYLCLRISRPCHHCGGKGLGWSYRSEGKSSYSLHVSCVKELLLGSWEAVYLNIDKKRAREIETRIPSLTGTTMQNQRKKVGNMGKCFRIAGGAVQIVMSAVLGDPTAMVAAVVGSFVSK